MAGDQLVRIVARDGARQLAAARQHVERFDALGELAYVATYPDDPGLN